MAAVLAPHPRPRPATHPPLRLVALEPERRTRPSAATFWRRRLVVLAALATLVVAGRSVADALAPDPAQVATVAPAAATVVPTADPVPAPAVAPAPAVYVVRAGDTVWSIAERLHPDGDVRALVDELTERAGGSALEAGQRIPLDGLGV